MVQDNAHGELLRELVALDLETETRPIRSRRLEVLDYTPRGRRAGRHAVLPGTITIFVARAGSPRLAELRTALAASKEPASEAMDRADEIYRRIESRTQVAPTEAFELLRRQPVFADIRYGSATLATGVFVPEENEVGALIVAYNGGRLARGGFTLVEHVREADAALDVLVVRHAPPLTRAEAAALRLAPADQAELNVGLSGLAPQACGAVAFFAGYAIGLTIVAYAYMAGHVVDDQPDHHLSEDAIAALGPAATARELLRRREEILSARPG
jgi:hypothetical protein